MRYDLILSTLALKDTDNAYEYYEIQSPGLGKRFLKSVDESYQKISNTPQYFSYINSKKDLRDIKINGFPFVIIFQTVKGKVFVLRVFNTNRNPFSF
jgi:plasmid stabilization system protein ParE